MADLERNQFNAALQEGIDRCLRAMEDASDPRQYAVMEQLLARMQEQLLELGQLGEDYPADAEFVLEMRGNPSRSGTPLIASLAELADHVEQYLAWTKGREKS